jgi:hypothetical protein
MLLRSPHGIFVWRPAIGDAFGLKPPTEVVDTQRAIVEEFAVSERHLPCETAIGAVMRNPHPQ